MMKTVFAFVMLFLAGCGSGELHNPKEDYQTESVSNFIPVAYPQNVLLKEKLVKEIELRGKDLDSPKLYYSIAQKPLHGIVKTTKTKIVKYIADEGFAGDDHFSFTVSDGQSVSEPAIVNITVKNRLVCNSLPKTGQSISFYPYDDGDLQKGATRSFTRDDTAGIVTDNVTGLMWQDSKIIEKPFITEKNFNLKRYDDTSGDTAETYCKNLTLGSYNDWRLPTRQELNFLIHADYYDPVLDPAFHDRENFYYAYSDETTTSKDVTGFFYVKNDEVMTYLKTALAFVRCVRGKSRIQHKFIRDDVKALVYDQGTYLMWQDNSENRDLVLNWEDALSYCHNLDFAGKNDWRLPNINELFSLSSKEADSIFVFKALDNYWSSTTEHMTAYAKVSLGYSDYKSSTYHVRCVRFGN